MEFKDYYKIMGVSPDADAKDIKRAYRVLARKYHPDVSKEHNAETKFKELGEAYEVLKDPDKRAQYDALRQQGWRGGETFNVPPGFRQSGPRNVNPEDLGAFSDFFESIFGQARPGRHEFRQESLRGEDVNFILEVSLEDSYHGVTRTLQIPITELSPEGYLQQNTRTISVKIPKGVVSGQRIRLRGQGGPGFNKGPVGDLYLEIRLKADGPYHVDGKNINLIVPITPWEAALGAKIKVPTLGGPIEVKVPPNSQTGSKLRLKGRGLPGHQPGDQFITLQVTTPPATSEKAKMLYQQMADTISYNPREKLGV